MHSGIRLIPGFALLKRGARACVIFGSLLLFSLGLVACGYLDRIPPHDQGLMVLMAVLLLTIGLAIPIIWLAQRQAHYRPRQSLPGLRGSRRVFILFMLPALAFLLAFLVLLPIDRAILLGFVSVLGLLITWWQSRLEGQIGVFVLVDAVEMLRARHLLGRETVHFALAGSDERKGRKGSSAFALVDGGYAFFHEASGREIKCVRRHFRDLRALGAFGGAIVMRFSEGDEDVVGFGLPGNLSAKMVVRPVLEAVDDYLERRTVTA